MVRSLAEIIQLRRVEASRIHRPPEYPGAFTGNYLLEYFSIDYCRALDQRAERDNFYE